MNQAAVLIVDSDEAMCDQYAVALGSTYTVHHARDGRMALAIVRTDPIDLILLEVLLPGIDGISLLGSLRSVAPEVPVVLVSALRDPLVVATGMRFGAIDYITKPFDDRMLMSTVAGALRRSPASKPAARICVMSSPGVYAALRALFRSTPVIAYLDPGQSQSLPPGDDSLIFIDRRLAVSNSAQLTELQARSIPGRLVVVPDAPLTMCASECSTTTCSLFISEIQRRVPMLGPPTDALALTRPVQQTIDYLAVNYARARVGSLRSVTGLSPYYVSRLFQRETRLSIRRFLHSIRLDVAAYHIATTRHSLEDIASATGFVDSSHLSRLFVRYMGHRPGRLRRLA